MTVYLALDEKIRINFFSAPIKRNSKSTSQQMCAHIGSITWDGFNTLEHKKNIESNVPYAGNGLETILKC